MRIKGSKIWITGASSGIGEALAIELFQRGATLILSARRKDKLLALKKQLDEIEPGRCFAVACDVTKADEVQKALEEVSTLVEGVDILVNNAGVSQRSLAVDTSLHVDRDLFEVNFFGAIAITKGILPQMIKAGGGHIVVISSMAGKFGFWMRSSYSASKHALHGFFESLRAELHHANIQVTLVCPGRINTPISVTSLTGTGQPYGIMDEGQINGVSAEKCARKIARAISCNRKEIFIGSAERLLLIIKRFCPSLFYRILNGLEPK